ncbi:MAG: MFS transporter [Gammaproteobacteria bacterium]|nr:MFS transporter [Gammaproteobacteria bacterium]MBU0772897.1 MFS transporter [Gammaproteobacteria bacterium]MBU0854817.1 MFS transporter [Gammaproteobacteria bacterium]MBU1847639.1 MFS transporter [Gammaproteobacteria bacterium]
MLSDDQSRLLVRLRWTAFILIACTYVLAFFHRTAPAAIAGELTRDFAVGPTSLGILAASYFWIYTLMQIPTGVLADTLGPRRIVAAGSLVAGIGAIVFALADSLGMAVIGRSLVGFGVSFPFIALLKINAAWFPERQFATLNGLTQCIGNLGAAVAATPLALLVGIVSWRAVFVALGVFSMLLAALAWLHVRDRPEDAGLPSLREQSGKPAHAALTRDWKTGLKTVAGNPSSWPGLFVNAGIAGSFFAFAGLWAVPYLMTNHDMSRDLAARHNTVMLLAFAFGALFIGRLSDHLQHRKAVMLAFAAVYLLCWMPLALESALSPAARYALFGLIGASASAFTLSWACAKEVNPPMLSGMATSLVNTGCFLGAALLQPMVGRVIEQRALDAAQPDSAAMTAGIWLLAAAALGGLAAATFIRETHARNLTDIHS